MADTVDVSAHSSSNAGLYLIPVCTLGAVALALVVARVHTRLGRIAKLYLDDWLIIVAEVRLKSLLHVYELMVNPGVFFNRHSNRDCSIFAQLG